MGATNFSQTAWGKDANAAFRTATDEARYSCGHEGYTGTIAEKTDFHLVNLKDLGLSRDRFFKALRACEDAEYAEAEARDTIDRRTKREQAKIDTKARRAKIRFEKLAGDRAYSIRQLARMVDNKWGAAVAIEITGKAAKELRDRYGLKGKKIRFYNFFGTASE